MARFGAIVSFEIDGGLDAAKSFAKEVKLWTLAESLGSVRSLFCHPATMTHASMEPDVRRRVGIGDGLIRLSVGLEDVRDLIEALDAALEVACEAVA
jgi:cystathionine beta-lyase/cystathionine gamma-synthase